MNLPAIRLAGVLQSIGQRIPVASLFVLGSLLLIVGMLALTEAGADPPHCQLGDLECVFARHETLAAGLLGAAGTVFAGWLAYNAAQQAVARALAEARAAKHAALVDKVNAYSIEIDRLKLARSYLETFAGHFPLPNSGASEALFVGRLRQVHVQALDFLSSSAARAPYGYGAQITTVMTRIEKLAERIEETLAREPAIAIAPTWGQAVVEAVAGVRSLAEQIGSDIPIHEKHLVRLADERDKSAQDGNG